MRHRTANLITFSGQEDLLINVRPQCCNPTLGATSWLVFHMVSSFSVLLLSLWFKLTVTQVTVLLFMYYSDALNKQATL